MATSYPFDPALRARVADLLYDLLPSLYRIRDMAEGTDEPLKLNAPEGTEPLFKFLHVLAAPLAEARQNVEELHADLFIDKCADWVLPYLADMIGMKLVFPDAVTNRRDVRGTMGWRRRKGTPGVLQEMASDLSGKMVVTQEGWKRILMTQDLNLLRLARTVPDLRPAVVAEQGAGPLDALFHAVDPRRPTETEGRYHPKHLAHWTHPTLYFPLREGQAKAWVHPDPTLPPPYVDLRYVFHPLGEQVALRVRRSDLSDTLATDRVPPMHFAASPGTYFDQEGSSNARFTVRLLGLTAGVASPAALARSASLLPAETALVDDTAAFVLLDQGTERWMGPVDVELFAVPLVDVGSGTADTPDATGAQVRGGIQLDISGGTALPTGNTAVAAPYVAMLRLTPSAAPAAYFPGATLEIACSALGALLGSSTASLASLGFLRGALVVEVPGTWVRGARWFYLAADGSVFDAQSSAAKATGADPDVALTQGTSGLVLTGSALSLGPGPAWPALPGTASVDGWQGAPPAPVAGPAVLHGGKALVDTAGVYSAALATSKMSIVLAVKVRNAYRPFLSLDWTGDDPTSATTFTVYDASLVAATTASGVQAALSSLASYVDSNAASVEIVARFEADTDHTVLPPCEMVATDDEGNAILIHLPTLEATTNTNTNWANVLAFASDAVTIGDDGSTHPLGSLGVARQSYGNVAPLKGAKTQRRRRIRQRTLCPWENETLTLKHAATPDGFLDIDPAHGLFAFSKGDDIPVYSTSVEALLTPPSVTVDYQEGYSMHVGARPAPRSPVLDEALETPTRLVVGLGRFDADANSTYHSLPRYATLTDALAAISASPAASRKEVVQIEDSATYDEAPLWPASITALTIQAAEGERPVLVLSADWDAEPATSYDLLTLRGLAISHPNKQVLFPPTGETRVLLCSALDASGSWRFQGDDRGKRTFTVTRSVTPHIRLTDRAKLVMSDSVVDAAGGGPGINAVLARVELDRVTVITKQEDLLPSGIGTHVLVLEASECIFTDKVLVQNRFEGCIRYSRVEPGSVLPRRHRVVGDPDDPEQANRERPRFVTRDRHDPAHARLSEVCDRSITRGAEDGSEMGAFHDARLVQRMEGVGRRLVEYAPAGLITGVLRLD